MQPLNSARAGAHMEYQQNPPKDPKSSQSQLNQCLSRWEDRFQWSQTLTNDAIDDLLERIEGEDLERVIEIAHEFADELREKLAALSIIQRD